MSRFSTYKEVLDVLYDTSENTAKVVLNVEMKAGHLTADDLIDAFRITCAARGNNEDYGTHTIFGQGRTHQSFQPEILRKSDIVFKSLYRLMFYIDDYDDVILTDDFIIKVKKLRDVYRVKKGVYRTTFLDCYEVLAEFSDELDKKRKIVEEASQLSRENTV